MAVTLRVMDIAGPDPGNKFGWLKGKYVRTIEDIDNPFTWQFTPSLEDALKCNPEDAFKLYYKPSSLQPIRPDGKPNRPLTAFTMMFEHVGSASN